jgi:hypothetical protein
MRGCASTAKKGNKMKKLIWTMIVLSLLGFSLVALMGCTPAKNYDGFAQCLTEKGVELYGAVWCPHCQNVKKSYGNSFRFMEYVECDENTPGSDPARCFAAGVEYFPMYKFGDGTKLYGEVSFDILSEKTGCDLP